MCSTALRCVWPLVRHVQVATRQWNPTRSSPSATVSPRAPAPLQGDVLIVHADTRTFEKRYQIATLILTILTSLAVVYELERSNSIQNRRP